MRTSKPIHKLLQITLSQYEDLKMQYWINYCSQKATSVLEWQMLLTERSLNKWFNVEFDKLEQDFRDSFIIFDKNPNITKSDRLKQYKMAVCRIYTIWLQPAVEDVRKSVHTANFRMLNQN
ncbi:MAG: hypothetical protein AB7D46_00665 [Flavobacteriaceae bacterium]